MIRIVLDETDFCRLVRGAVVRRPGAELILADIGWNAMLRALADALPPTMVTDTKCDGTPSATARITC